MKNIGMMILGLIAFAGQARAFCSYGGKDYAITTVTQEFRDARYVAEIEVMSGVAAYADEPDRGFLARWGEEGGNSYRLKVIRAFKGAPPKTIRFFTERNSGGFYFDRSYVAIAPPGTPDAYYVGRNYAADVGGRYLMFLNPIAPFRGMGTAARGATFVNYACGQSKPWREVTLAQRELLQRLTRERRSSPRP